MRQTPTIRCREYASANMHPHMNIIFVCKRMIRLQSVIWSPVLPTLVEQLSSNEVISKSGREVIL